MVVPATVIQVHFQNALPLAAEDFNALLKDKKFAGKLFLAHEKFPEKNLSFLIMLRSVVNSISFPGKKKMPKCIMRGKNPAQTQPTNKQTENPSLKGLSTSAK